MLVLVLVLVELFWTMHVYVLVSTWYVFCHAFLTMTSGPDGYYDMNRHGDGGGDGGRDQGCWTQTRWDLMTLWERRRFTQADHSAPKMALDVMLSHLLSTEVSSMARVSRRQDRSSCEPWLKHTQ